MLEIILGYPVCANQDFQRVFLIFLMILTILQIAGCLGLKPAMFNSTLTSRKREVFPH